MLQCILPARHTTCTIGLMKQLAHVLRLDE